MAETIKVHGIEMYRRDLDNLKGLKRQNNVQMLRFWKLTIGANFGNNKKPEFDKRWNELVASL